MVSQSKALSCWTEAIILHRNHAGVRSVKYLYLPSSLLLIGLLLSACSQNAELTPAVEARATVPPPVAPIPTVEPTATALPTDPPTPTDTPQPTDTPEPVLQVSEETDRLYRSCPAPTGYPGFRKYYQKRCYPGCHSYDASDRIHL